MGDNQQAYTMTISLNALKHLGINLYSNVPAVLSELVANAYDADATEVKITVDDDVITIADNGHGMSRDELNQRYLTVGYSRRKSQPAKTASGRSPMGRKGIGKLAAFSIADIVEVHSKKDGETNSLSLSRRSIEDLISNDSPESSKTYHPDMIEVFSGFYDSGTTLVLKELRRQKSANLAVDFLKKRLARRFTVIGARNNFRIFINEIEVTPKDRGYYSALEFIWSFGNLDAEILGECTALKMREELGDIVHRSEDYKIKGWIGTVSEPKQLGDKSEEGNSIVIYARGKLVQENILSEFREARVFAQYIIGDIEADFIDLDDLEDLATSDRQRLVADDPRYQMLKAHIEGAIKHIGLKWSELRKEQGSKRALENPVINEWFLELTKDNQKHARKLFGKIESLPMSDERSRKELYKASILAFERMALVGQLEALEKIDTSEGLEALFSIFNSIDELETVHYYEIAKGRLEIIRKLQDIVDENDKEKVLQEHLFTHLWLLDTSWERASGSERIEQSVTREFNNIQANLTDDEKKARIDIRYQTMSGKHVIVELKRYGVNVSVYTLAEQVAKYKEALTKVLREKFPEQSIFEIETVCILGSAPYGSTDPNEIKSVLQSIKARYVTYDSLITGAQKAYSEYLARHQKITKVRQILDGLDNMED